MKTDSINLGSSPADEPCAQVGEEGYEGKAMQECKRYIDLIRNVCGKEPAGARLVVKSNLHDFGYYYSVECKFNSADDEAINYAYYVDNKCPTVWSE